MARFRRGSLFRDVRVVRGRDRPGVCSGRVVSGHRRSSSLGWRFVPPSRFTKVTSPIGKRIIPWMDIRRLDRTGWISPLIVRITLFDDSRMLLVYPGDLDSCNSLLRHLRRLSRDALIDGIPYRQYWGELLSSTGGDASRRRRPRYRILRPEDEAEVERLYQRLKTVGNLDQKNSTDEK